ncbi:chemotaxis protein CheA [bacterium]|nr:MAG: chemotaxis protein CheA [bacterium]
MNPLKNQLQNFLEEALEIVEVIEKEILQLEVNSNNESVLHSLFRNMHTLKGSGGMFGFTSISEYAHMFENIYDSLRNKQLELDESIIAVSLESVDHFRALLKDPQLKNKKTQTKHDGMKSKLSSWVELRETSIKPTIQQVETKPVHTWHIHFKPVLSQSGMDLDPISVLEELKSLGTCVIVPNSALVEPYNEFFQYEKLDIAWDIILSTRATMDELQSVFLFFGEESLIEINAVGDGDYLADVYFSKFVQSKAELLMGVSAYELMEMANSIQLKKATSRAAKTETERNREAPAKTIVSKSDASNSIRVETQKVDLLLSLVSELVTAQARLSLYSEVLDNPEIVEVAEDIEKITRRLRENAFSISMVPISTMETRYKRLIRDLATKEEKLISFRTEGLDTEIDKSLIEQISPALLHVFRNSVDHGIETPEKRKEQGKPESGEIVFRAYYSGSHVVMEISDDGNGLNLEKIKAKAIKKGLIKTEQKVSEAELMDLLFHPGFSTADKVTDVSGRGVGMDVVRTTFNKIRGEVFIESKKGFGTKIIMHLPLTLSILDGLLVSVGSQKFIIPLQFLDKCFEVTNFKKKDANDDIIVIENEQIPVIDLREIASIDEERPVISSLPIVMYNNTKVGFLVDKIIGEHQAVIKSLGKIFQSVKAVSGASILGDGEIALILDVNKIISDYTANQQTMEV